jgi:hypothetical protein
VSTRQRPPVVGVAVQWGDVTLPDRSPAPARHRASRRQVQLLGSIPAPSAEAAIQQALDLLGTRTRLLPDGETGDRQLWILNLIRELGNHPDLELRRPGDWSDYDHTSRLGVRRGHRFDGHGVDLGHVKAFETGYAALQTVAARNGRDDLSFLVGLPGDFDMALFTFGPLGGFRYRKVFADLMLREIEAIHSQAGDRVVFQLELPAELVFVTQLPKPLRALGASYLARQVTAMIRRAPVGARFALHLCLGDLQNKALGKPQDAEPMVVLANALLKAWPSTQVLDYLHLPFAAGETPAPLSPPFYRPLNHLTVPPETRLIAGFIHESQSDEVLADTLRLIETAAGRPVDIATACGLGRRTPQAATQALTKSATTADN